LGFGIWDSELASLLNRDYSGSRDSMYSSFPEMIVVEVDWQWGQWKLGWLSEMII
jgi:hypothetical protein